MLSRIWRQKNLSIGLQYTEKEVMLLLADTRKDPQVKACYQFKNSESAVQVKQLVKENRWSKIPCHVVLPESFYQLILTEDIEVPMEEKVEALQWRIKDMVAFNIENAVIDFFPQPNKKMLYVVAVENKYIKMIAEFCEASNLLLKSISIPELSLRNYIKGVEEGANSVCLVSLKGNSGHIFIYKENLLYLSRNFLIDFDGDFSNSAFQENLTLEIQRSIDYYERQLGEVQPNAIMLAGNHLEQDELVNALANNFTQEVSLTQLNLQHSDKGEDMPYASSLSLMGAAMRECAP